MVEKKKQNPVGILGKIYVGVLIFIFGLIVIHAPLTVAFGTLWPKYDLLIKSWKEILMLLIGPLAIYLMYKSGKIKKIIRDPIIILIAAFALLHILLLFVFHDGISETLAGLAIDLRFVLYFALVYIALCLYPQYRRLFIKVGIAGALVVLIFAFLQVFILPYNILKYIGYNKHTIVPYLLVDRNRAFVRINSTLRGPNPVGAYASMVLTMLLAAVTKKKVKKEKWPIAIAVILLVGALVALWASYSRSAQIGVIVSIAIVLVAVYYKRLSKKVWITIAVILLLLAGGLGLFAAHDSSFISNVVLHTNPAAVKIPGSNEGHINSIENAFNLFLHNPLGGGVGTTGSASLMGSHMVIIEDQYLFVAHEAGWLGLVLFLSISVLILVRLWKLRSDWFALGVFASGIGLMVIGIFLPVWTDDTVSIIWWGLAAIALFPNNKDYN
jgi:hypothetical protein